MKIYKITKGNFALENTRDIRPHENNLRFHIQIEGKYYEYAIDTINKKTLNVRCVIAKSKFRLIKYLGLFSRRDAIPDQYYEDPDDPESVLPENLENPK